MIIRYLYPHKWGKSIKENVGKVRDWMCHGLTFFIIIESLNIFFISIAYAPEKTYTGILKTKFLLKSLI